MAGDPLRALGAVRPTSAAATAGRSPSSRARRPDSARSSAATLPGPVRRWSAWPGPRRASKRWRLSWAASPRSATVTCDVADTATLRAVLDEVAATQGPVDLLVNNAAQDPGVRLVEIGEDGLPPHIRRELLRTRCGDARCEPAMVERGQRHHRQRVVRRRAPAVARAGRLPLVEGGPVGVQRVDVVPARARRGSTCTSSIRPSWPPSWAWGARPWAAPAAAADDPQRRVVSRRILARSRWTRARDHRVRADRRRHGLPLRDAPHLPPAPPELVGPPPLWPRRGRTGGATGPRPPGPEAGHQGRPGRTAPPSEPRATAVSFRDRLAKVGPQ